MSNVRVVIGFAIVALVVSLSVAPAAAEYPPTDPPNPPTDSMPTVVGGTQATNQATNDGGGSGNLAFTGRTVSGIAGVGGALVAAGSLVWFVGQRRRVPTG